MSKIINVGGKSLDLSGVLPFSIKNWKKLKTQHGITPQNLGAKIEEDIETMAIVVHQAVVLVDPSITLDQVEELTPQEISEILTDKEGDIDRPISTGSTTSQGNTDGQPAT